jgi:16S rRNA (cytosine967-C5)-methyltransferase
MNKRPTLSLKPKAKPAAKPAAKPRPGPGAYAKPAAPKQDGGAKPEGGSFSPRGSGERSADAKSGPYGGRARPEGAKSSPYGGARPDGAKFGPRGAGARDADAKSGPYGGARPERAKPAPYGTAGAASDGDTPRSPYDPAPRAKPYAARAASSRPNAAGDTGARDTAPRRSTEPSGLRASHARALQPSLQTGFKTLLKPDSLAFALSGAAAAVAMVGEGTALPAALNQVGAAVDATPQSRGAMQDIGYRCMRQLGQSQALVAEMAPKAPDPMVAALLHCALALMTAPDEQAPYEEFTVVDQAVTAADAHPDTQRAKGMVNAVLRRFLRERASLLAAVSKNPEAKWNYPQWWIDAMITAWPQQWQQVLTTGNSAPPLTLRVNVRKNSVEEYLALLEQHGMAATRIGASAVRLAKPVGVHLIPGFAEGRVSVQDAGAQLAAPLLDVQDGMRVLDACAAPGGKTGHILELAKADVTALDADPKRLQRVAENLERLQLQATLRPAEAQNEDWWDGQQFDRILADVPCTASGIVRRHPDIRWLRRKSDTLQLATLSAKILDNLWQMLRPNGKLLFVTCSLWPQESEAQAAAFAVRNNALRLDAPGQLLPAGGIEQDHDGLFYALFQKHA